MIDGWLLLALRCGTATRATLNWPVMQMFEAVFPFGGVDLVDAAGRAGDAGVVDEAVEAAEIGDRFVDHAGDLSRSETSQMRAGGAGGSCHAGLSRASCVDIADVDLGAFAQERLCGEQADATGAGRDQNAQAVDVQDPW